MTMPGYSELRFSPLGLEERGHEIYWHQTINPEFQCYRCKISFVLKSSLMEIVQEINPGQPPLPEWVHQGAIMGVQGGTNKMLEYLDMVRD